MDFFEPGAVRQPALWESIVVALRRAIILGELPPGLHLEEPSLAAKFGVSRIPIREAVIRLAHEQLVRIEPRRGAFIVGVTEKDLDDIYELRVLLEGYAARKAAERIDDEGVAGLHAVVDRMVEAARQNQLQLTAALDLEFHRRIITFAGNPRLVAAWEPIGGLIDAILAINDATVEDMPHAAEGHRLIIRALESGDPGLAEERLRFHIQSGMVHLQQAIRDARESAVPHPQPRSTIGK